MAVCSTRAPPGGLSSDVATERLRATAGDCSTVLAAADGAARVAFATVYLDLVSVRFRAASVGRGSRRQPEPSARRDRRALLVVAWDVARYHGPAKLGLESGRGRVDAHRC